MDTINEQANKDLIRQQAEEAFMTGHYPYLMQALAVAVSRCQVWRMPETDNIFTVIEMFNLAKEWDEQHPPKEEQFYIVSIEGAIGRCYQAEWLATWLFIPMEPGEERDALLKDMQERLAKMAEEEEKGQDSPA